MSYKITNISRGPIHENLDTKDANGNLEVFSLGPRETTELSNEQFASRRVQKHVQKKRLKVQTIA